jgi:hypothetical protein
MMGEATVAGSLLPNGALTSLITGIGTVGPSALVDWDGMLDHGEATSRVKEGNMHASEGDRIVIHGHRAGEPDRDGEVLSVLGADSNPPYVVRWGDSGHESIFFPGSDATIQHFEHTSS